MAYAFLSQEWLDAVRKLRDEAGDVGMGGMGDLVLNIKVEGAPDGDKEFHLNQGNFEDGFVDDAPTKITVPYDVAKQLFVEGNQQAAMQAFMSGQIKIEGDMTKLMALQSQGASATPEQVAITEKIKEITE